MTTYILKRLALSGNTLLITATATFVILAIIPGDLAYVILGDDATPERLEALRMQLGIDQAVHLRYLSWLGDAVRFDFGQSAINGLPVVDGMKSRIPVTLELAILAQLITVAFAVPAGVLSAVFRGRGLDLLIRPVSIVGIALPSFWVALLVLLIPSFIWNYAPPRYVPFTEDPLTNLQGMLPPAAVLGMLGAAGLSRLIRAGMLGVLREDYIRTARSKGLAESSVVFRHGLRNTLGPVITVFTLHFSTLLGGTVIIESIFSIPGLGALALRAIESRDYPVVQAFVVFMVFVYVMGSLIADLLVASLDPRVRLNG